MLCESSVQEVMDLTPVAHCAALEGKIPFINFFDGFRTSHEIQKIETWDYEDLKDMVSMEAIDEFRAHALNPVDSVPTVFSNLLQGTCDAVTYNTENEKGYMAQNPGIVPIHFAEGEGFKQEVTANVGCRKGSDKLLKLIDKTLKGISQEERDQMWDACLDRQPA